MMFLIFYFLLIRPQQKKQKEQQKLLDSIKDGENIVTHGGIHGTVRKIKDDVVTLEIAPGVRIKINRSAIGSLKTEASGKEESGKEKDNKKEDGKKEDK